MAVMLVSPKGRVIVGESGHRSPAEWAVQDNSARLELRIFRQLIANTPRLMFQSISIPNYTTMWIDLLRIC
jgi:hypothetical protein